MTQTISININSKLLANAQSYSKEMGSDLSQFVEMLLYQAVEASNRAEITSNAIKPIDQLSPFVQSLCGVVKNSAEHDNDIDGDNARLEYLEKSL